MTEIGSTRILVVEDDEAGGTLLVDLLGTLGDVHRATSAEQGSEMLARHDWDLPRRRLLAAATRSRC